MKKILLCLCLLFGYSVANDKNGLFLGLEFGISEINLKVSSQAGGGKIKLSAPMYGLKAGYRHFFTDLIGLQGYFSFKDSFFNGKYNILSANNSASMHFMPFMANADVIFDFYKANEISFDAILGVGLGMAMLDDNLIGAQQDSYTAFYSDARVGLGINSNNNRVGLNIAFPIAQATKSVQGIDYKMKQNYIVSLTYDYKF